MNGPDNTGLSPVPWNRTADARVSTNDAYLDPARGRTNLQVMGDALVDRVQFDHDRAIGLWVETIAGPTFVEAGEVILSAGATYSPAILLRSGVGPADPLRALEVEVVADLPGVGRNLHDHPVIVLPVELLPEARAPSARTPIAGCFLRWQMDAFNDVGICPLDIFGVDTRRAGLMVALLQPFSRGELMIASRGPRANPSSSSGCCPMSGTAGAFGRRFVMLPRSSGTGRSPESAMSTSHPFRCRTATLTAG